MGWYAFVFLKYWPTWPYLKGIPLKTILVCIICAFRPTHPLPYRYLPVLVCVVCAYPNRYDLVCMGIFEILADMALFKGNSRINNLGMHNMRFWSPSPFAQKKQTTLSLSTCFRMRRMRIPESVWAGMRWYFDNIGPYALFLREFPYK